MSGFLYDQQGNALRDSQGVRLTTHEQALIWMPGSMVGGQGIKMWFCLDGSLGLQRQLVAGSLTSGNQVAEAMTAAWAPRLSLSVGIAFRHGPFPGVAIVRLSSHVPTYGIRKQPFDAFGYF